MRKLWERYILYELTKLFVFLLAFFYFFYVLVDYSVHTKGFHQEGLSFGEITLYYFCQFSKQAGILVPVALMISSVKVLTTMNLRGEIVALAAAGISFKRLMRPLLLFAFACTMLLYLNIQFIQPLSLGRLHLFEEHYFKGHSKEEKPLVHSLLLQDNTLLLYQRFDPATGAFFDVFWINSFDRLYRIKNLYPFEKVPFGTNVDLLTREKSGEIVRESTFDRLSFPEIRFDPKELFGAVHPPAWQSLSRLFSATHWKKLGFWRGGMNDKEAESTAFFFYKLTNPLICLLAVIAIIPFCIRFGRALPVFFIYAFSLFGIVAFFTLINASLVLGESQIIPPIWAILIPPFLLFVVFGRRYARC